MSVLMRDFLVRQVEQFCVFAAATEWRGSARGSMGPADRVARWLRETRVTWVGPSDLERCLGLERRTASRLLGALRRLGLVSLVKPGLYHNRLAGPLPNVLLLHREICPDSYISFQTALHLRGVIDQAPHVVTCARWNGPSLRVENDFGEYWFERVPRRFAFGFEAVLGGFYEEPPGKPTLLRVG